MKIKAGATKHLSRRLEVLLILLMVSLPGMTLPPTVVASKATLSASDISAASAIVISADTGDVLWEKDATGRHAMASTTKIMTGLIAIECSQQPLPAYCPRSASRNFTLDEVVEVGQNPQTVIGSLMNSCMRHNEMRCTPSNSLRKGERLTLLNLLHGMLLPSGNDAALAVAEFIACGNSPLINSGTICLTNFVELMNARAVADDLRLNNTRYKNPYGHNESGHFSSAYDLAKLARVALGISTFASIVRTFRYSLQSLGPTGEVKNYPLRNTNQLLDDDRNTNRWRYHGANGVKTGTSQAAGLCLVSSVTLQRKSIIAVVLGSTSNNNRYGDSTKLLDYGSHVVGIPEFPLPILVAFVSVVGLVLSFCAWIIWSGHRNLNRHSSS
jgi:D-alanyl-D-alanine carboxypeptidase (penicillin-binding protein 5/6)